MRKRRWSERALPWSSTRRSGRRTRTCPSLSCPCKGRSACRHRPKECQQASWISARRLGAPRCRRESEPCSACRSSTSGVFRRGWSRPFWPFRWGSRPHRYRPCTACSTLGVWRLVARTDQPENFKYLRSVPNEPTVFWLIRDHWNEDMLRGAFAWVIKWSQHIIPERSKICWVRNKLYWFDIHV